MTTVRRRRICILYTCVYYTYRVYGIYLYMYRTYTIVLQYTYIILYARRVNIVDGGGKIQQPLYSCTRISYSIFISETTATAPPACTYICGGILCVYVYVYIIHNIYESVIPNRMTQRLAAVTFCLEAMFPIYSNQ